MLKEYKLMNYDQYINTAESEELEFINELYDQGQLLEDGISKINCIDEKRNILVITATRCKDSATIVPFLMKLAGMNKNIQVEFLLKKDSEELLEKISSEIKVPSILLIDEKENLVRKFIEFPVGLKRKLINNPKEKTQEIIDEMRAGKYNDLIQKGLIELLTGENYEYIRFDRKDK